MSRAPRGWKITTHAFRYGGSVFDRYHTHEARLDQVRGGGCFRACGYSEANAIAQVLLDYHAGESRGDYRRAGLSRS